MDVVGLYESTARKEVSQSALIEYYCAHGCLLLHVWQSPHGRLWYQRRYKLSPATAEAETVASARGKRTDDGFRIWRSRGGSFDELIEFFEFDPKAGGLSMNCHHLRNVEILCEVLAADAAAAKPGQPTKKTLGWTKPETAVT